MTSYGCRLCSVSTGTLLTSFAYIRQLKLHKAINLLRRAFSRYIQHNFDYEYETCLWLHAPLLLSLTLYYLNEFQAAELYSKQLFEYLQSNLKGNRFYNLISFEVHSLLADLAWVLLGIIQEDGRADEALGYVRSIEVDDSDWNIKSMKSYKLGKTLHRMGKFKESAQCFESIDLIGFKNQLSIEFQEKIFIIQVNNYKLL